MLWPNSCVKRTEAYFKVLELVEEIITNFLKGDASVGTEFNHLMSFSCEKHLDQGSAFNWVLVYFSTTIFQLHR